MSRLLKALKQLEPLESELPDVAVSDVAKPFDEARTVSSDEATTFSSEVSTSSVVSDEPESNEPPNVDRPIAPKPKRNGNSDSSPNSVPHATTSVTDFEFSILHDIESGELGQQYRQLVERIRTSLPTDTPRSILLASVDESEDTATMLAYVGTILTLNSDDRTLLIDANVFERGLTHALGRGEENGLAQIFDHQDRWSDLVGATAVDRMHFLPAGRVDPILRATTIATCFANLEHELKSRYRYILVDAGRGFHSMPVCLTKYCDLTYLVLQLGQTEVRKAQRAVEKFRQAGSRLVGCIAKTGKPSISCGR